MNVVCLSVIIFYLFSLIVFIQVHRFPQHLYEPLSEILVLKYSTTQSYIETTNYILICTFSSNFFCNVLIV